MSYSVVLDNLVQHGRALGKALLGMLHSAGETMRAMPDDAWAVAALVAALSVIVTSITACLWPRASVPETRPAREAVNATGVRQLARRGLSAPEIARRTGLSHDAVATIIRAGALVRGNRTAPTRKTRPSAA